MDYSYFGEFVVTKKWALWLCFAYFLLPLSVYLVVPFLIRRKTALNKKSVSIIVLGDIGHSPRMCYHAISFAKIGYSVSFCGYLETAPPAGVIDDINIDVLPIKAVQNTRQLPYLVFALLKITKQLWQLFELLLEMRGNQYFMIQNPPCMPVLAVVVVFIKLFSPKSKLIIDWHNLNYSILNLRYKNMAHPVVRVMRLYERFFSQFAWLHITVTDQMKLYLVKEFHVAENSILTLHDRPGSQFTPLSKEKSTDVKQTHAVFADVADISQYKVVVTATSFTPDEDLDILLDALKLYHDSKESTPPLFVLITGKGPMKSHFLAKVDRLAFLKRVILRSAWLSAEDYPEILGVADLAVSLHSSLSGIDLPMKIVDFFGVGVPVITLSFPAIGELVQDGVNGLVMRDESEILKHRELYELLVRVMSQPHLLYSLKSGAMAESEKRWNENWMSVMAPVVDGE